MSGPSTLRICLAAMAPALTEAASARMRLQDTGDTQRNSSKAYKPCHKTNSVNIITRSLSSNDDLKTLGSFERSKGEGRVTHLSLADSGERNTVDPNSKVSPDTCKAPHLQSFTKVSTVPKADSTLPRSKAITLLNISKIDIVSKPNIESPFYVSEDFQEGNIASQTSSAFLNKLKIMNKPETGTLINKESGNSIITEKSEDISRILKSDPNHHHASIKNKSESSMVNGNGDIDANGRSGKSSRDCDEKGDAPQKKIPTSVNKRSVHFTVFDKPRAESSKDQDKMGRPISCAGKDSLPSSSSGQIMPLEAKPSQLFEMETLDMKTRDETRKECARKQAYLERKVETLLRRLKRMRGKIVETHSREQLRQFVNYQHRSLQHVAKVMRSEAPGPAELKEHFLSNEEVKSMSTTELVKLVKTYQPLASAHNSRHLVSNLSDHRGISSSSGRLGGSFGVINPVMVMEPGLRTQCAEISERLGQRIANVSSELDSDATASSSGGESGDEEIHTPEASKTYPSAPARPKFSPDMPPLFKRAEWRWASDRAGIVSRWTWLQAQVSDLEYRIRQQSQVHRQLRASKGGVVLGDPPSTADILRRLQGMTPATSQATGEEYGIGQDRDQALLSEDNKEALEVSPFNVQAVMSNVDKQASRLTQSLGNCLSPASSSASAPSSMVGSPRVASSVSSPAQASIRDQSPHAQAGGLTDESTAELPKELCPNSRTSDLLLHTPESQRQPQRVPPSSVLSSSSLTVPLSATTHLDATCQSARCRPLRSYRKRRILRTMGLHRHSHKAARLSDIKCRCAPPANPCPMCGGRQNNTMPMDTETMSLRERVALVDASFHPVLSFPEDVSLPIHCEGLLKSGLWQDKPAAKRSRGAHRHPHHYRGSLMLVEDYRQHTKKRLQNNNNNHHHHDQGKVLALVTNGNGQDTKKKKAKNNVLLGSAGQNNRNNGGSAPSTASVIKNFSEKIKNKYDSKAKSKGATTKKKTMASMPKKVKRKASKMSKDTMKKKKEAEMRKEEEDDLEALYLDQGFADIDGENGGGSLSASASQSSLRDLGHQSHRGSRRRVDNSYDINNIVIPLSMAASVPVEQPQYKEIVTPKWREIPMRDVSLPSVATVTAAVLDSLAIKLEKTNGVAQSAEQPKPCELESALQGKQTERVPDVERKTVGEEEEEEDLSDEAYALRHLKLELEEKKRFRNFVQYPPLRRSRARSDVSLSAIDKGESMPQSEEGSLSSRPTTPVLMKSLPSLTSGRAGSLEESFVNLQSQRPRTMSVSTPASRRETRQGSQAGQDGAEAHRDLMVEPWPRRSFPLVTEEFESMLREAPPEYKVVVHQHETRYASSNTPKAPVRAVDSSDRDLLGEAARAAQTVLDGMAGVGDSVALSPQSASASASVSSAADDDIADPEWTGGADNSTSSGGSYKRGRSRRILDDPNDPEWLGSDTPRKNKNKR